MEVLSRIDGVAIGLLIGFDAGAPLVVFAANPADTALAARSLCELDGSAVGAEVALLFEEGDPARPLIVGRIVAPAVKKSEVQVVRDGQTVCIEAEARLELRCGDASIILEKDGRISIRGTQLTSHARGVNRIKGAAVHLN
ncbi:MAG: phage baseplate assembly protein V [Rhizobiaceae bacterium]|nr:phage baseplate assembly protein V [Rhizobiaceae bacterium]